MARTTTGDADGAATENLASRISDCIAEAEARGLHVVAAYLDVALNALRGAEIRESNSNTLSRQSPH